MPFPLHRPPHGPEGLLPRHRDAVNRCGSPAAACRGLALARDEISGRLRGPATRGQDQEGGDVREAAEGVEAVAHPQDLEAGALQA